MQNRCGGGDFLRAGVNGQARLFALTPVSPSPAVRERGIMECGSEASAHAEANASALQTGQRAAPLSHIVGEGLGVRAKKRCVPRTQ